MKPESANVMPTSPPHPLLLNDSNVLRTINMVFLTFLHKVSPERIALNGVTCYSL
jgi:hypothetical protein